MTDVPITRTSANSLLVTRWLLDLQRRNLREATIRSYKERMRVLLRFYPDRPLLTLELSDMEEWLDSRPSANTRRCYIVTLDSFFRWAIDHDLVDENPSRLLIRPRLRPGRPHPVADDQLALALANAPADTRVMILLGALAGLRVSEIAGLAVEDLDLAGDPPMLEVVDGKGGKSRLVPVHAVLADALIGLPLPVAGPLFFTNRGTRRTGHSVGDRIRAVLTEGTPHGLRHFAATRWYAVSRDIRATAELLGHSDPRTTLVYARFEMASMGAAIVRAVDLPAAAPFN